MAAQGRDIKLSSERIAGYRNFATKLWNAARFAEMNGCARDPEFDPYKAREDVNLWIIKKLASAASEVTAAIETYKFNDAAGALYRFTWNVYCDWYLEFIKPVLTGPDSAAKKETRAAVVWLLDELLKLLHPFMPFITEELWQVMAGDRPTIQKRENLLALSGWPSPNELNMLIGFTAPDYDVVIGAVTEVRAIRTELNIALRNVTSVELQNFDIEHTDVLKSALPGIARLIGANTKLTNGTLVVAEAKPPLRTSDDLYVEAEEVPWSSNQVPLAGGSVPDVVVRSPIKEGMVAIHVRAFDTERERARLQKAMAQADADIARVEQKLRNADFLKRAPEEVVEGEREKREEAQARREKLAEALERLKGAA
jgi:valyl-tRNA synthetase